MSSDDLTVIWYTYSTISQTLAGAFGFLTAVCVYQMQSLSNQLVQRGSDYLLGQINKPPGQGDQVSFLLRSGRFEAFRHHITKCGFTDDHDPHTVEAQKSALQQFDMIFADYAAIKSGLRASLSPTVCTIILSILFLSLTNSHIIASFWTAWIILFGVILGSIYCIVTYVHLAETIVRDDGFKNLRKFLRKIQHQTSDSD